MSQDPLGDLIRQEYHKMVNYVRRLIDSATEMDAEDFVQEVLLSVLERTDPAAPLENLAGYVYRSLRNRVIDFFRVRKRTVTIEPADNAGEGGLKALLRDQGLDSLAEISREESHRALYEALQQLKDIEQAVIVKNEFEGIGFRELSQDWGIPVNTLLSHKARAIEKLRRILVYK